jgi:hypothetical protein
MEGRTTAGRWHAPCAAVRLLRTRRSARQLYDLWDRPPPPCHRMDTPVCIVGDFSRRFEAGAGESAFKEGFIPRVAAMPCFCPTHGILSPPSSLRPFVFKVSALHCRSLPWPCKFIPSVPRPSECSTWYTACLDGMRRRSAEGFAPAPSTPVNLPLESSCLLSSRAGWCCRSCLSSAGGAQPCGSGSSTGAWLQGCSSASQWWRAR